MIFETCSNFSARILIFGFFARCENLCEGLVPIEALGNGFFFDKDNLILQRGKTSFRLGQLVRIKVLDADIRLRRITFGLIAYEEIDAPKIDYSRAQRVNTVRSGASSSKRPQGQKKSRKTDRHGRKTISKSLRKKKRR